MIIIGIAFLIGLISTWYDEDDFIVGLIAGIFTATVGFIVAMMVGALLYHDHTEKLPPVPLVNLVDNNTTQGSFFLGSGTIDNVPQYSWYEQNGDNSYVRRDVEADMATIHFTTGTEKPYYTRTQTVHDGKLFKLIAVDVSAGEQYDKHYDFYIPRGSIKQDYTLDAK